MGCFEVGNVDLLFLIEALMLVMMIFIVMTERESPLTCAMYSTYIFITQETEGLISKFSSLEIAWRRQSVVS